MPHHAAMAGALEDERVAVWGSGVVGVVLLLRDRAKDRLGSLMSGTCRGREGIAPVPNGGFPPAVADNQRPLHQHGK